MKELKVAREIKENYHVLCPSGKPVMKASMKVETVGCWKADKCDISSHNIFQPYKIDQMKAAFFRNWTSNSYTVFFYDSRTDSPSMPLRNGFIPLV